MLWETQDDLEHHVNVRALTEIDPKFEAIDKLVKARFELFKHNNTKEDSQGRLVLDIPSGRCPRIVTAGNRFGDLVILGIRHFCPIMNSTINSLGGIQLLKEYSELDCLGDLIGMSQGFLDQYGYYYTRREAMIIAEHNNQIIHDIGYKGDKLFTEHMY